MGAKSDGEGGYDNPGSPSARPSVIRGGENVSLSLKNWGGGKNMHVVLELSPPVQCGFQARIEQSGIV